MENSGYFALYRKYRPETFDDVISQPHITDTLRNQIKTEQTAHAYLFTGSRGTGKTSCAKILSKAVNCLTPVNGNPCLKCDNCRAVAAGTPDVVEIDAASNNSVDGVRMLQDELGYLPVACKYKVYIIDEVHMFSKAAWAALLKTIEEPPKRVMFILATTDTHKIPVTILSRCQRFGFRRIDSAECAERLLLVAEKEGFTLESDAAEYIARLSDGGMRDALSTLDTAVSHAGGAVTVDVVRDCVGACGKEHIFAFARAVHGADTAAALTIVSQLHARSKDLAGFIDELLLHFRNLMIIKAYSGGGENGGNARLPNMFGIAPDEQDEYFAVAELFQLREILAIMDRLETVYTNIKGGGNAKTNAEVAAVRLTARVKQANTAPVSAFQQPPPQHSRQQTAQYSQPPPINTAQSAEYAQAGLSAQPAQVARVVPAQMQNNPAFTKFLHTIKQHNLNYMEL